MYGKIKAKGLREEVCHNSSNIKCSFLSIMAQPTSDHSDLEQQQQQGLKAPCRYVFQAAP